MSRCTREPWRSVLLLAVAYMTSTSAIFVNVSISALFVRTISGTELATLPTGLNATVSAVVMLFGPLKWLEGRFGRQRTFVTCYVTGIVGSLIQLVGAWESASAPVIIGSALQGFSFAAGNRARFYAADLVDQRDKPRALSVIVLAGVFAVLGPELSRLTLDAVPNKPFVGSYIASAVIMTGATIAGAAAQFDEGAAAAGAKARAKAAPPMAAALGAPAGAASSGNGGDGGGGGGDAAAIEMTPVVVSPTSGAASPPAQTDQATKHQETVETHHAFTWSTVGAIIGTTAAYGVMAAQMQTSPLAILEAGHSISITVWVTEAHVAGMFLPSLFSGPFIAKFGSQPAMLLGWVILIAGGVLPPTVADKPSWAYFVALAAIGVGWNLTFVAGSVMVASVQMSPAAKGKLTRTFDGVGLSATSLVTFVSGSVFDALGDAAWWLYIGIAVAAGLLGVAHLATRTPDIRYEVALGVGMPWSKLEDADEGDAEARGATGAGKPTAAGGPGGDAAVAPDSAAVVATTNASTT